MRTRTLATLGCVVSLGLGAGLAVHAGSPATASPAGPAGAEAPATTSRAVSGTGTHLFTSALVHGTEPTATGFVQRSTETVELAGDLVGRLLYQPVSTFDLVAGTLVNTGHQVFSGTVCGSAPVLLHDDRFRFEVDLTTGATVGEVHLVDRVSGPQIRCHLAVVGTGRTPDGNASFDYSGECRLPGP